jgi:hypothetical protein
MTGGPPAEAGGAETEVVVRDDETLPEPAGRWTGCCAAGVCAPAAEPAVEEAGGAAT